MKQLIPKNFCLTCDVCCRFLDKGSPLRPIFLKKEQRQNFKNRLDSTGRVVLKEWNNIYICPFFLPEKNICSIYRERPFDCKLYPFIIYYNENGNRIILGMDKKCPFIKDGKNPKILKYSKALIEGLENKKIADEISKNPLFIGNSEGDYIPIAILNRLTTKLVNNPQKKGYKKLGLEDKKLFGVAAGLVPAHIRYSFINLYIWKDLMDVWWKKINGKMDILLEQGGNLIEFNKIKRYKEYVYHRADLTELKGDRFKHKRSSYNFFVKNYRYEYLGFKKEMKEGCLKLFSKWSKQRKEKYQDQYYQRLIDDSFFAHKTVMEDFEALGLVGRIVKIDNKIAAYTFGFKLHRQGQALQLQNRVCSCTPCGCYELIYPEEGNSYTIELNEDTFCILFEITDLNIKGLSQFIFREFCKELISYKYINLMDDSGLENLRKVKESYKPVNYGTDFHRFLSV